MKAALFMLLLAAPAHGSRLLRSRRGAGLPSSPGPAPRGSAAPGATRGHQSPDEVKLDMEYRQEDSFGKTELAPSCSKITCGEYSCPTPFELKVDGTCCGYCYAPDHEIGSELEPVPATAAAASTFFIGSDASATSKEEEDSAASASICPATGKLVNNRMELTDAERKERRRLKRQKRKARDRERWRLSEVLMLERDLIASASAGEGSAAINNDINQESSVGKLTVGGEATDEHGAGPGLEAVPDEDAGGSHDEVAQDGDARECAGSTSDGVGAGYEDVLREVFSVIEKLSGSFGLDESVMNSWVTAMMDGNMTKDELLSEVLGVLNASASRTPHRAA
ncbi:unnamed protein product [Prorocentrum cordatum]|uniref:Selenoprotein F/M domain-containing protein n=1 Tax=Prorocentrum cordatum TaxID=2364126 RepID=A0ABN9Q9D4_9DINO|nr:unnamed protein product [Polarella glacialis]